MSNFIYTRKTISFIKLKYETKTKTALHDFRVGIRDSSYRYISYLLDSFLKIIYLQNDQPAKQEVNNCVERRVKDVDIEITCATQPFLRHKTKLINTSRE